MLLVGRMAGVRAGGGGWGGGLGPGVAGGDGLRRGQHEHCQRCELRGIWAQGLLHDGQLPAGAVCVSSW